MKTFAKYLVVILLGVTIHSLSTVAIADHGHGHEGMHHDYGHSKGWMKNLNEEQRKEIDKLHLEYKKKKLLLKAQIKQAKIELALLVTSDSPNKANITKKIDQIMKLKTDKLTIKTDHQIAVRKVLNEEQRVAFDMHVLKKASHSKKGNHKSH